MQEPTIPRTVSTKGLPLVWPAPRLHPFQQYLEQHYLSWLQVARQAKVPCLIVWNIAHGVLVRGTQAIRVRVAVHQLTGVSYTGPMNTPEPRNAVTLAPEAP